MVHGFRVFNFFFNQMLCGMTCGQCSILKMRTPGVFHQALYRSEPISVCSCLVESNAMLF